MPKRAPQRHAVRIEGRVIEVGASSDDGGTTWEQGFHVRPWREVGGELRDDELRIDVRVGKSLAAGDKLEGKTVTAAVRELGPSPSKWFKGWTARARTRPTTIAASRVPAAKPAARAPTKVRDAVLGTLEIEAEQLSIWRGPRGHKYEVLIATGSATAYDKALANARVVVARVERSLAALHTTIAGKLLETCNRWRASADEPALTRAAFIRALHLASISIGARSTSLIFECGELFGDHGVEVRLAASGRVTQVEVA